jgi:hypothetical protein
LSVHLPSKDKNITTLILFGPFCIGVKRGHLNGGKKTGYLKKIFKTKEKESNRGVEKMA